MEKEKHPSWFKLKSERRRLIEELPPECAVNVLLACLDYLDTGRFPETLSPIEKIAASAFMPDLEDAWVKYRQRVEARASAGMSKGNRSPRKGKQSYDLMRPHAVSYEVEVEEDTPKGVDSSLTGTNSKNGDAALVGGPPTRFYIDDTTGKVIDRGGAWG